MKSVLFHAYRLGLTIWHRRIPIISRTIEALITYLAVRAQLRNHYRFPIRTTGGWFWTTRVQFEYAMQWHERDSLAAALQHIQPGDIAIDIGAHVGYYTQFLADCVGSAGCVYAFEPHPDNFGCLVHNMKPVSSNVQLFELAISDCEGDAVLHLGKGNSTHSLAAAYNGIAETVRISTTTLDRFTETHDITTVNFIKIDAEGAEFLILRGARALIQRAAKLCILLEVNDAALRAAGSSASNLITDLRELGFDLIFINGNPAAGSALSKPAPIYNLLASKCKTIS